MTILDQLVEITKPSTEAAVDQARREERIRAINIVLGNPDLSNRNLAHMIEGNMPS